MKFTAQRIPLTILALALCLGSQPTDAKEKLTRVLAPLAANLEPDKKVVYKTVGDRDLHLHVFSPDEEEAQPEQRPCLLLIHGGGWTGGEARRQYPIADHYAKLGVIAISLEYRLLGDKKGNTVFDCVKDGRSAVRYLRFHAEEFGIDPNRIAVSGASAGGHVALGTAVFENGPDMDEASDDLSVSCRPDLLIPMYPVIDTSGDGYGQKKIGERWQELSPVHHVKSELPPMLILHGTGDTVTPFAGAERFVEQSTTAGNDCELFAFEEGRHGWFIFNLDHYREAQGRMDAFLEKHGWIAESRAATDDEELRQWLENMVWHHRFDDEEISRATGLSRSEIAATLKRFAINLENSPVPSLENSMRMMPYPGGRHPRIGFLEGAILSQRETKVSVFTPWNDGFDYVVVDVPEALWSNLGLTYLAHTHIDTIWSKDGIALPKLEWKRDKNGRLKLDRTLPNQIHYEAKVLLLDDHLEMELRLTNGTANLLTDLRVQNCVMLKGAPEFASLKKENKRFAPPFAAVRSATHPKRWIITAWEPCHRPWGNPRVPCLHSDPRFPDCEPGETQTVRGWLSFYEGDDVEHELKRITKAFFSER